jgi:hypothetical protein
VTNTLIKDRIQSTCITPSFLHVADLNSDGKPDVYVACTGIDFTIDGVWTDEQLSSQYVVLSQSDGSYKIKELDVGKLYGHNAALADIDGDGKTDVLSTDPVNHRKPVILWGVGDGTFTLDTTRFPSDTFGKGIFSIEAIPIDGKINVFLSGITAQSMAAEFQQVEWAVESSYGTKILRYANGRFETANDFSATVPKDPQTGREYGAVLNVVYDSGFFYILREVNSYADMAIVKTNATTGESSILQKTGAVAGLMKFTSNGTLVMSMSGCPINSATSYWSSGQEFDCKLQIAK